MQHNYIGRYFDKYRRFFSYDCQDYTFDVDLQNGELYFSRKLISFSGKYSPINLSLNYSQMRTSSYDDLSNLSSFPLGFKTNYHILLEYDSFNDKYIYEDAKGFEHEFKKAVNSNLLYYDTFGSGLMLIQIANGYKVFDDDGNYQEFDSSKRLISINKKISANAYASQHIYYQTDLKISSIVDNYGRTISFIYNPYSIQIKHRGNVVITLHTNNNLLTEISKNIDGHTIDDTVNQSSLLLDELTLAQGQTLTISYFGGQITSFVTNINQDAFFFEYDYMYNKWVTISNARGVSTRYDFNDSESVTQTSENDDDLAYLKINTNITSCLVREEIDSREYVEFTFGGRELTSINVPSNSSGSSNFNTNHFLFPKKMYLLVAEIEGNLAQDSFEIQMFDYDRHLLGELVFKGQTKLLSFPIGICASTEKTFRIFYKNNCPNSILITKVELIPLIGDFEILCSNIDFGGPIFFYGDEPHYLLKNSDVILINGSFVSRSDYCFKSSDYLANERNFYKNTSPHLWCNDQKVLIDRASNVLAITNVSQYISYNSNDHGIYYCLNVGSSITPQELLFFHFIEGKDDNSFSVRRFTHCNEFFRPGFFSSYYEEQLTKYVVSNLSSVTYSNYNENYALIELSRNDGYKEQYSYDNHGNLLSKIISHRNADKQIKEEHEYDSDDNLMTDNKLIGSSVTETNYDYDDFGNILHIYRPNASTKYFGYDSITGERSLGVMFLSNYYNLSQSNNFISVNSNSLSINNVNYLLNYSCGRLTSVSCNNQEIVNITYHEEVYCGKVLHTSETTNYSNGGTNYTKRDAFDRVSIDNGCFFAYSDTSKIGGIIDGYYDSDYPSINYQYDYFDQVIQIDHWYNRLSIYFTYDIYHRLTSKSYEYYYSPLYEVTYGYYNNIPGLENATKTSSISYGSTIIDVSDDRDAYSRLIQKEISFNNHSIINTISYCCGGPNNAYTNQMVSSVTRACFHQGAQVGSIESDNYTYDSVGNITSIQRCSNNIVISQTQYVYNAVSHLTRENNQSLGRTYTYTYDTYGNITSKKEYLYTTNQSLSNPINTWTYSYNSNYPDRLSSFGDQSITYDTVGNPINYLGKSLSWAKGTLLSQFIDNDVVTNLFYDGLNQRVRKQVDSVDTYYQYINKQLIVEKRGNQSITYLYSHDGIIGFVLSGYDASLNLNGKYIYEKNILQDVVAIRNTNNVIVASYVYDAWGNHKVLNPNGTENTSPSFIGNINPIRYRSYYYDTDLKMYWLTTRYYDPKVGRFISPDHYSYLDYQKIHGINLYCYAKDNPVMYYDPSGHFALLLLFVVFVFIVVTTAVVSAAIASELTSKKIDKTDLPAPDEKEGDFELARGLDFKIYYEVTHPANGEDKNKYNLKVWNSWKYSKKEIETFLNWLKQKDEYSHLNVKRVGNEWLWHNIAYFLGIKRDSSTKDVDAYFDYPDPNYAFIFDNFWLWW